VSAVVDFFTEETMRLMNRSRIGWLLMLLAIGAAPPGQAQDGAKVFKQYCASCHEVRGNDRAPPREVLSQLSPEQILRALEAGAMQVQGAERSRAQRRAVAEYLSGKTFGADPLKPFPDSAFCANTGVKSDASLKAPAWNGWGVDDGNTRFQPTAGAGLSAVDVPALKLKWAFGLPGASSGGSQPVVAGGRLYFGDAEGDLFALDAKTGCIFWRTEVEASIRTAPVLGPRAGGGITAYIGDQAANVYAIDAADGKILWKVKVDDYAQAAVTASPQLHHGVVYVPVSSREESKVGDPRYPCCAFRGSIVALDAVTGKQAWKTFTIGRKAAPSGKNSVGTVIVGPSGVPIWNTPSVDEKRGVLYVGTGNNYSPPATAASDSIVSFSLKSGAMNVLRQHTEDDIWNASCRRPDREKAVCPQADSPDADFGSSPVLVATKTGKPLLVTGNKSGSVWALDPAAGGKTVWETQVGKGSSGGGVLWGIAVGEERVFVPNGFFDAKNPDASGGMTALDLNTGKVLWSTPNPPCGARKPCKPSHAAAISAMPGVVFSGTMDGQLYAYDAATGKIIWAYNSVREFTALNGVSAKGGSMSNSGPTIAGGMVYVQSGYSHHGAVIPGNVLLAFSPE
jgi:polyvinyl alcohol dehydrogenase (cytochrome)